MGRGCSRDCITRILEEGGPHAQNMIADYKRCQQMAKDTRAGAVSKAYGEAYESKRRRMTAPAATQSSEGRLGSEKRGMIRAAMATGNYGNCGKGKSLCKNGGMTTVFGCSTNQLYASREPLMHENADGANVDCTGVSAEDAAARLKDITGFEEVDAATVLGVRVTFYELSIEARKKYLLYLVWDGVRNQPSDVPDEYLELVFGYPAKAVKQLRNLAASHHRTSQIVTRAQGEAVEGQPSKRARQSNETSAQILDVIEEYLVLYCKDVPDPQGSHVEKRFISTEIQTKSDMYYKCMATLQDRGILEPGELMPRTSFFRCSHYVIWRVGRVAAWSLAC